MIVEGKELSKGDLVYYIYDIYCDHVSRLSFVDKINISDKGRFFEKLLKGLWWTYHCLAAEEVSLTPEGAIQKARVRVQKKIIELQHRLMQLEEMSQQPPIKAKYCKNCKGTPTKESIL